MLEVNMTMPTSYMLRFASGSPATDGGHAKNGSGQSLVTICHNTTGQITGDVTSMC